MSSRTQFAAKLVSLNWDDSPETERKPVSGQAKRYVIDGLTIWARSYELAVEIART